jgi:hypothetical protein
MRPDPTTPGPQPKPTALTAAVTTAAAGTPAGLLLVWLIQSYVTVRGKPIQLDALAASTIGSVGASAGGYLWRVIQALMVKWGLALGEP